MAETRVERARGAKGEVDQLQVMHGHICGRVAARNPFRELAAADRLRFQQRAIAVVDVLQHAIRDQRAQLFVIGVGKFVIHDFGKHAVLGGKRVSSSSLSSERTDGFSMRTCLPVARAARAGSKWRSSGVATQTACSSSWSSCRVASMPE